jgi:hypothetical protein
MKSTTAGQVDNRNNGLTLMQFAVGYKLQGTTGHVVVDAEDALIAALKIKAQRPEALIIYVRRQKSEVTRVTPRMGLPSSVDLASSRIVIIESPGRP